MCVCVCSFVYICVFHLGVQVCDVLCFCVCMGMYPCLCVYV